MRCCTSTEIESGLDGSWRDTLQVLIVPELSRWAPVLCSVRERDVAERGALARVERRPR